MTVCIASICALNGAPTIVGAADRMITVQDDRLPADIQYERTRPKIFPLDSRAVALLADDISAGADLCHKARVDIAERRREMERDRDPIRGIPFTEIEGLAQVYRARLMAYREQNILGALRLTAETFLGRQNSLEANFVERITNELRTVDCEVDCIIAGVDNTGAHLYRIDGTVRMRCLDEIGYEVIGGAGWHAESEFTVAQYEPTWTLERAVLLAYTAKKRAERASGVGQATDVFMIGAGYTLLRPEIIDELEKTWRDIQETEQAARERGYLRLEHYIRELLNS